MLLILTVNCYRQTNLSETAGRLLWGLGSGANSRKSMIEYYSNIATSESTSIDVAHLSEPWNTVSEAGLVMGQKIENPSSHLGESRGSDYLGKII